jgi:hypothetical protein
VKQGREEGMARAREELFALLESAQGLSGFRQKIALRLVANLSKFKHSFH